MEFRKVTAIIRSDYFGRIEEKLIGMRVSGMTVTHVMGYGEYANFFNQSWLTAHVRIEIFTEKNRAEEIARAIVAAAHTGGPGDGLVVILPVEKVFRIRTKAVASYDEI